MAGKVISLADRHRAKQASIAKLRGVEEELFLIEEGLDLLASYRSITDGATRQRLRALINSAARGEEIPTVQESALRQPATVSPRKVAIQLAIVAQIVIAALVSAFMLEAIDPAPMDVQASARGWIPPE